MSYKFDSGIDTLSKAEIAAMQTEKFRAHIAYCKEHSPFYRELLRDIDPVSFALQDLHRIPFTTKKDVSGRTDDFLACAPEDVRDIVYTSGTTGMPCKFVYTANDIERVAYNEERCYRAAGVRAADKVLLTCTLDRCFIAGLAFYLGATKLGVSAIRNGLSSVDSHLWIVDQEHPTVIVGIASFLVKLAELAKKENKNLSSIKKLICVGEPVRTSEFDLNEIGQQLRELYPNAEVFATYASTEIITSFSECPCHKGGHLLTDLAYIEVVDADGNPVPDGENGELVITPFQITGMPLLRFRSGDIGFIRTEQCECGRNALRLGPIQGRRNHLLKFKGTSIYPQVIFNTLAAMREIENYYVIAEGEGLSDTIRVCVSIRPGATIDTDQIQRRLSVTCRVKIPISIVDPVTASEMVFGTSRKPMHFFDRRKKNAVPK